jgi:hypothetical protein
MRRFLLVLLVPVMAGLFAPEVQAEDQLQFPRLRQLQDMLRQAGDGRYQDSRGLFGQDVFTMGFSAGYISDHYWRGFRLFDSDLLFRGDAYVSIYGFEASFWGLWDVGREQNRPLQADYRFRYSFEFEGALVTAAYTWYDFSGSDGDLGTRRQGFGRNPLRQFPGDRFPPSIHELNINMTYFTSVLQEGGANLRYTLDFKQRLDGEGTRIESIVSFFVDSPQFTIFGDYIEVATTTTYQHRYLTDRSHFQGQQFTARLVYNLDKYNMFPVFFLLEAHYVVAFHSDLVDGFHFGASMHFRF